MNHFLVTLSDPAEDIYIIDLGFRSIRLDENRCLVETEESADAVRKAFSQFAESAQPKVLTAQEYEEVYRTERGFFATTPNL